MSIIENIKKRIVEDDKLSSEQEKIKSDQNAATARELAAKEDLFRSHWVKKVIPVLEEFSKVMDYPLTVNCTRGRNNDLDALAMFKVDHQRYNVKELTIKFVLDRSTGVIVAVGSVTTLKGTNNDIFPLYKGMLSDLHYMSVESILEKASNHFLVEKPIVKGGIQVEVKMGGLPPVSFSGSKYE